MMDDRPHPKPRRPAIRVRNTRPEDFDQIVELCKRVYVDSPPWRIDQLHSHLQVFPEGQFVAVEDGTGRVYGMAASLIVAWADYDFFEDWKTFTDYGMFTNHDPTGRTLYGAEVLVDPASQRRGVGSKLYKARRAITERLRLLRIRAHARLRGYHKHAEKMSAEDYVKKVVRGELKDPTLSFQIKNGFVVLGVVGNYLWHDSESMGWAAVIEWLNEQVATPEDVKGRNPTFLPPR